MKQVKTQTYDGNQAAASIAHLTNEVIAIYPITPASPMGEFADEWSAKGQPNIWGTVPHIIEMQSEAGAAGTIHGALQAGALATTFTASQGLLLMIPNMYKIAGELTPTVFHIAARSLACQALSIFGDHSDVMSVRMTGFAMLSSNSPQEVQDLAMIAQAATLESRIPVLHFFDGFRTSHEVQKINIVDNEMVLAMLSEDAIQQHRQRAMSPDHPVIRGTSQNPDVYFQGRESSNPFYIKMPSIVQATMDRFASLTGRQYRLFEYLGDPNAERLIILMGSAAETTQETVEYLQAQKESVGMIKVRLYRPLDTEALLAAIPASVKKIAVLDRTKEPGADGEPLYKDVVTAIAQHCSSGDSKFNGMPVITGGRYGLSSKEFTPGMVKSIFDELVKDKPKAHFTIGIHDDLTHLSLDWDKAYRTDANHEHFQAMFYGLGSDGTVSANKNSIKIIGEATDMYTQGYFVYDSKKSGAVTVSHLRFGPDPIRSTYLIGDNDANFVACHQPVFLERYNMLDNAADEAVFLLNSNLEQERIWDSMPKRMQEQIIQKRIKVFAIDAYTVAEETGMGKRINTIMQTCFFAISGVLPRDEAIQAIKDAVEKTYGKKGQRIVDFNFKAIDAALHSLHEIKTPDKVSSTLELPPPVPDDAPDFIKQLTGRIISGHGDDIPVSLMPNDGTYPTGTANVEKRNLALELPVWEMELCTDCGKCPLVCPHAAIRSKLFDEKLTANAPSTFKHRATRGKEFPAGTHITYQVAPEDCTGCGLCVEICPIRDKSNASRKALNMAPQPPIRASERDNWNYYLTLPEYDRSLLKNTTIKGSMMMQPLFEFSGACVGCGETPYIKLATQLFGDRMLIANATGCSSIYGGNLPTTPYCTNPDGRGPAWNNSLFEDNAEFGLGLRMATSKQQEYARELVQSLSDKLDSNLVEGLLNPDESSEAGIAEQRARIEKLKQSLQKLNTAQARDLLQLADMLSRKSIWIIGGDGWAYDIGYGGVDHVLASGHDVNLLVLDTEVYSNTGGQTSKATPRGAVAKFSAAGKSGGKKDLALLAMEYENVYVAHIAYGAKDIQTLRAFHEAESHDGPSLIIAYSPCIAHGVDMCYNHRQQEMAVKSGHWPLFRFDPKKIAQGQNPLHLDSAAPTLPYEDFIKSETRFSMLWRSHPDDAERYLKQAQREVHHRYQYYKQLSEMHWDDETKPSAVKVTSKINKQMEN
ncbi:MAG: pyruvate:ferredoxin (flavodoxin) oxidoreductase [Gammaproteobacteria bacterium]|nr:pyruvate:ferredoxin (flavodoxin) oxidoreductase [Gammaproteobacteria bacterium]